MRKVWIKSRVGEKESGQFGIAGTILFFTIFVITLYLVLQVNKDIVGMAWKGFVTYMKPNYLYPDLNKNELGRNNAQNIMWGAKWLYENVVMREIVNPLLLLILLLVGLAYIYADFFEQFMGKLKSLIPRIVIALILTYTSIYIFEGIMLLAKAGYVLFYNAPAMGGWKNSNYIFTVAPFINIWSNHPVANSIANWYWGYLWVFVIMTESLSLLVFVAFRIVMLGILLVLLPIASILLIHPWTQQIGARIWWLMISLAFVPIAMIIPLMLSTLVVGSVSFVIASLTAVLGSIYLLAKEPFILGGLGFQRAGNVLTGGIVGGGASGNLLAPARLGTGTMGHSLAGMRQHAIGQMGSVEATPTGMVHKGYSGIAGAIAHAIHLHRVGKKTLGGAVGGGGAGAGASNFGSFVEKKGGVE